MAGNPKVVAVLGAHPAHPRLPSLLDGKLHGELADDCPKPCAAIHKRCCSGFSHHCWVSIRKAGSTLDVPHIHSEPVEPVAVVAASVGSQQKFRLAFSVVCCCSCNFQAGDRPLQELLLPHRHILSGLGHLR